MTDKFDQESVSSRPPPFCSTNWHFVRKGLIITAIDAYVRENTMKGSFNYCTPTFEVDSHLICLLFI
jgi:hypothetical protein